MYDYSNFLEKITNLDCKILLNEPLKKHTLFKIGGPADVFLKVNSFKTLSTLLKILQDFSVSFFLLGNGSNLLVSDRGVRGVVIKLSGDFEKISMISKNILTCGAGALLSNLCIFAKNNCLTGAEFLWGIPGTVGGALYMNAGAYGGEMKNIVKSCTYLTKSGEEIVASVDELELSYRKSKFFKTDDIITSATFNLNLDDIDKINAKMSEFLLKRKENQPLNYPNAGSIFRKPEQNFAGALIENCGLKGKTIGGAMVSDKHAGFIVNTGNATCQDVLELVNLIKNEVYKKMNVLLECEVKIVGEFN